MRDDTAMQVSGGSFPPCVAPPVLLPAVGMDRDARCRGRAISHRRMDGLGDDTRTRLTALYNSSTSINPCITCPDDPCIIKDKKQMIKCNVTVCGVIGRDASVRKNKEEKEFLVLPLRVQIPATGGGHTIEVDVRKEGCQEEAAGYRNGSRVEVRGTMYLKRRGDKLYFNLFADEICNAATDDADCVKGELVFRGKVGQNIEEKRDKKDQPYTVFSAFSAEKVDDGFEYQWVRFFCFGKEREAWLQPGVKVDAKGEMNLSAHNGKINLSCKMEELTQYVADSSNYNQ